MEVIFRTRQLQRNYEDAPQATMQWGRRVGCRYIARINFIIATRYFPLLFNAPCLRLHPLRGPQRGKFAIYLTRRWRLIVSRGDTAESIVIEEVSNHYDD